MSPEMQVRPYSTRLFSPTSAENLRSIMHTVCPHVKKRSSSDPEHFFFSPNIQSWRVFTHKEVVGREVCYPERGNSSHQDLIGLSLCIYKQAFCKETRWVPPTPAANTQAELRKACLLLQSMKCSKAAGTHFLRAEMFFSQTKANTQEHRGALPSAWESPFL